MSADNMRTSFPNSFSSNFRRPCTTLFTNLDCSDSEFNVNDNFGKLLTFRILSTTHMHNFCYQTVSIPFRTMILFCC